VSHAKFLVEKNRRLNIRFSPVPFGSEGNEITRFLNRNMNVTNGCEKMLVSDGKRKGIWHRNIRKL